MDGAIPAGADNATIWLCPNCATHCPFTKLDKSCMLSKVSYVIDNGGTIIFAIFMSFWGKLKAGLFTQLTISGFVLDKKLQTNASKFAIFLE